MRNPFHTTMKIFSTTLCLFSLVIISHGELTLDAVTRAVLDDNPALKEARAKFEAMKQRVPQAAAWEDLKVSAGSRVGRFVDVARNSFTDQMVSVEQMIPLSGKNQRRARIASIEAVAMVEEIRRKQFDLFAKAKSSFHRLASAHALLDLNSADEASLSQTVEITRAKFQVGGSSQAEVLSAENEVTKLRETRKDLEQKLSEDETQLSVLMGRDPFKPLGRLADAASKPAHFSVAHLKALVVSNRPEVRMAEVNVQLARAKLDLARREWIPDPALSVQAQRYNGASQPVSEVSVGVSITLPWLNGGKYRAQEKEAAGGIEAAQRALEAARTESLGMLRDQLRKIETNHHHVELYRDQLIPTARQTVEANRAGYETNKPGFLELIMSQRNLREMQSMYQQHIADYEIVVAELEAIIGANRRSFTANEKTIQRSKK